MKRLNHFDIAKGIGITLVILGHTCRDEQLRKVIYFFHMPLFFIISGFFFSIKKHNTYLSFLKNSFKSLVVPYVTFYILSCVYWILIERHVRPGADQTSIINVIIGFFYGTDYKDYMEPNGALWFLWALFIARNFLYFTIKNVKSNLQYYFVILVSIILGSVLSTYNVYRLPLSINSSFVAFSFMSLGFILKSVYESFINKSFQLQSGVIIITILISYLAINYNTIPDMDYVKYGNIFLFIMGGISGTLICLFISQKLKKSSVLEYLGKNSLIIFSVSEPIKRAVIGVFAKLSHHTIDAIRYSIGFSIICVIIVLLIELPIVIIFNKYLPFLIGRNKN